MLKLELKINDSVTISGLKTVILSTSGNILSHTELNFNDSAPLKSLSDADSGLKISEWLSLHPRAEQLLRGANQHHLLK